MTQIKIQLENNKTINVELDEIDKYKEYLSKSLITCTNCGGILSFEKGTYFLDHYQGCKYLPKAFSFTKTVFNGLKLDLVSITQGDKTYKTKHLEDESILNQTSLDIDVNKARVIERCIRSQNKTIKTALTLFKEYKNNVKGQTFNGNKRLCDIVAIGLDYAEIYKTKTIKGPKLVICRRLSRSTFDNRFVIPSDYCLFRDYFTDDLEKCVYFLVRHQDKDKNKEFKEFIKNRPEQFKKYANIVLFSNDWQIVENDKYVIFKSDIHWDSFAFVNASSLR